MEETTTIIPEDAVLSEKTDVSEEKTATGDPVIGRDTLLAMLEVCRSVAQDVDDSTAVQAKALYSDWEDAIGQTVDKGFKFRYAGELYKTMQDDTEISAGQIPGEGTEDIYEDLG